MTARIRAASRGDDAGFTLVELLLSVSILVVVMGSIAAGMVVFLKNGTYTSQRDDHSGGAIVAASYVERDGASATTATTGGTTCSGTTNQLLLTWDEYTASVTDPLPVPAGGTYRAAYTVTTDPTSIPAGGGTRYRLERVYCPPTGPAERSTLARNLTAASAFAATVGASGSCPNGQRLTAALTAYGTDSTPPFSFSGCVKGRQR